MFLDFFHGLREAGVPVSIQEWRSFLEALEAGLHGCSLLRFYHLGRACLVKSETYFDAYDRAFLKVFRGVEGALGDDLTEQILDWLKDPKNFPELTPEQLAALEHLTSDELMRRFLDTLAEQTERHDGGDRWVGTGGRSPYGHGGVHPTGIRVGGPAKSRSAMKVAEERRFSNYRTDVTLDVRQMRVGLRRLRQLTRTGQATELDLDETIDETCRNAGEIELVFRPPRRNNVRLLLLMDVGGTMEPFYEPVSQLLTALCENHGLREFQPYYFHNCVYDHVWRDNGRRRNERMSTLELIRTYGPDWKVVFVGDAAMSPYELTQAGGSVEYANDEAGIVWLTRIFEHFRRVAWWNPEPSRAWEYTRSTQIILQKLGPRMFPLTLTGIAQGIDALRH